MQVTWWEYRQWRFLADMNADGLVTASDVLLWAKWAYFVPGDALIAQFGTTPLGNFLELTPASFGSATSAALSAALWLLVLGLVVYLPRFFVDIVDPTSRQQRRERRQAQRLRRRQARSARRAQRRALRREPQGVEELREPRFEELREPLVEEPPEPRLNRRALRYEERREPHF